MSDKILRETIVNLLKAIRKPSSSDIACLAVYGVIVDPDNSKESEKTTEEISDPLPVVHVKNVPKRKVRCEGCGKYFRRIAKHRCRGRLSHAQNRHVSFVKEYALKHDMPYIVAVSDKGCREEYYKFIAEQQT